MKTDTIIDWLRHRADGLYAGEPVTQLEHALQCARLAQEAGAAPELVTAAMLHDIYHLAEDTNDAAHPHDEMAAQMLSNLFPPAVTEPIRLHVQAKRYLCATESSYWSGLSDMSRRSLMWQGGPFTPAEAVAFLSQPFAENAVALRRWDDAAKAAGVATPPLDEFIPIMKSVLLDTAEQA